MITLFILLLDSNTCIISFYRFYLIADNVWGYIQWKVQPFIYGNNKAMKKIYNKGLEIWFDNLTYKDKEILKKRLIKENDKAQKIYKILEYWKEKYKPCISCNKPTARGDANACHWISREYKEYRRLQRNINIGCVRCNNRDKQFHQQAYTAKMYERYWMDRVNDKIFTSKKTYKLTLDFLIDIYKKLSDLEAEIRISDLYYKDKI